MTADIIPFELPTEPDVVTIERDGALFRVGIRMANGQYHPDQLVHRWRTFFNADVWARARSEKTEPPLKIEYRFTGSINSPPDDPEAA